MIAFSDRVDFDIECGMRNTERQREFFFPTLWYPSIRGDPLRAVEVDALD